MSNPGRKRKRNMSLDFLRGTAVIFMMITHVNALFYSGVSPFLDFFIWWGATVCFTIFLFVSGSVTGIGIALDKIRRIRIIQRVVYFLVVYYATVFLLKILRYGFVYDLADVFDVIVFRDIPEFTEFIVPFIVYPLVILFTPAKLLKMLTKPLVVVPLSLVIFYVANYLYAFSWGDGYINVVKGILVGHGSSHRFGVLSYFPVFALGIAWGRHTISTDRKSIGRDATVAVIAGLALFFVLKFTGISVWERWPPSLFFLLYGIAYSFLVLCTFGVIRNLKFAVSAVAFMGVNAFKYYVYHIIILYMIGCFISRKTLSEVYVILLLIAVIVISTVVILIRNKSKPPFKIRIKC